MVRSGDAWQSGTRTLNGSISWPYARILTQENGPIRQFVLPAGCEGACALHVLRSRCKAVLRIAYAIDREEKPVPVILLDFWNLLSNVFFQMALKENRLEGVSEIPFVFRSYDVG